MFPNLKKAFMRAAMLIIIFILLVISSFFFNKNLFHVLVKEDGVIEYTTAILLLLMSFLLVWKIIHVRRIRGNTWLIFNTFFALGLFFGFGEEISWGQRLFDITPGTFFTENNLQKETNLHNLNLNGFKVNKWIFSYGMTLIIVCYFFFLLPAYKMNDYIKRMVDKFGVPIPQRKHAFLFAMISLINLAVKDTDKWELLETLFAAVLFLVVLNPYNAKETILQFKNK